MSKAKEYIWVIGDIHGMHDHFITLLNNIRTTKIKKIIFLGDVIDRGPSAKEVVDKILELKCAKICLMGNHEHMMLDEINSGKSKTCLPKFLWEFNGGSRTVNSFGFDSADEFISNLDKKYLDFFNQLKISHKESIEFEGKKAGFIFVHAGLHPYTPLEIQLGITNIDDFNKYYTKSENDHSNSPVWVRNSFFEGRTESWDGNLIIHGHTPTQKMRYYCTLPGEEHEDGFSRLSPDVYIADFPFLRKDREKVVSVNIDTGAAYGGRLTAVGISEQNIRKTADGIFLKLEFIQIDGSYGLADDEAFRFLEYDLKLDDYLM
jgi:serine/threonine protein phosphatase 1